MGKGKQDRKKLFWRKSPLEARDGRKGPRGVNVAVGGKTLEDEGGYHICYGWVGWMRKSGLKTMRCCLVGAATRVAMLRWGGGGNVFAVFSTRIDRCLFVGRAKVTSCIGLKEGGKRRLGM
jgi:hypothetical protein